MTGEIGPKIDGADRRPAVSVIITSYNQAQYIAAAINSVLQQTHTDHEIIVVDDGSTDDSLEVLAAIRQRNGGGICVYTHPGNANRGIKETYSLGISRARAPYLAFLEADDVWAPNYLAEKVSIFDQSPEVGVVFSPCEVSLEGAYGIDMMLRQTILNVSLPKNKPFSNFGNLLRHNNVATFSAFMVRSSLVQSLPRPNESRLLYFDWWMLIQLSMRSSFYFDTKSHIKWRQSKRSFMGRQTFQNHKTSLMSFFEDMYCGIEESLPCIASEDNVAYRKKRKAKAHFVAFYSQPSISRFLKLFKRDPRWALESLASYLVNYLKHDLGRGQGRANSL